MSTRTVLVSAALLAFCGAVTSQPPPPPAPGPIGDPLSTPPAAPRPDLYRPAPVVPTAPTLPLAEKTVEELLTELERVQSEKAALEKKEQELKATVRKKLEQQAERLNKLGVTPKDMKTPDRVGQIFIEGNTKTADQKILDKLDFRPGQVLQYPSLEIARAKLEKAGFKSVTVEAVPGELDATFKDIRVRVEEPKP